MTTRARQSERRERTKPEDVRRCLFCANVPKPNRVLCWFCAHPLTLRPPARRRV